MPGVKHVIIFVNLLFSTIGSFSQQERILMDRLARRMDSYTQGQVKTSVYLTCNKDIFIAGEDLWFNVFVLDSRRFSLSDLDKILYLQLTKKDGDSVVWKEMYPVANGISGGHVYLPQTLAEGVYLLKAYTARSFFSWQPYFYAVAPIQIVKSPQSIKRDSNLGQALSPAKGEKIQLEFFPEGGTLVAGLPNLVAFKALNKDQLPLNVSGTLLKNGAPLNTIKTFHAGMGSIMFTPEANAEYAVRIESDPESLFKLPPIADTGVVMHLEKNENDSLIFKIAACSRQPKKVFLRIQVRGMLQSIAAGTLTDILIIKFPAADMAPGIAEATLFDEQLHPLARRLLFLQQENKLNIHFSEIKDNYAPKEQVSIKIKTTNNNGKPVRAVLSLRVYDQLFANRKNVRDLVNYYHLSTQLSHPVYDPSYYFDNNNSNRQEALDLLLLTMGTQQYNLSESRIIQHASVERPVLSDSLKSFLLPVNKSRKNKEPVSLLFFNHNRSLTQVTVAGHNGIFYIKPQDLFLGRRFFIKYFSANEHNIRVTDPFDTINAIEQKQHPLYLLAEKSIVMEATTIDTGRLQYGKMLQEVVVRARGRGFGDRYLGYLDSIARFEANTDYVGACGWLNCPACGSGKKPVEGITYSELIEPKRSQVNSHPFAFTGADMRKVTYSYPQYSEEVLLKKFKMVITKGFYQHKEFFQPNYSEEDKTAADTRNTLYWNPIINTDENGEATISFFCSDILARYIGVAEGACENAHLGSATFSFSIR